MSTGFQLIDPDEPVPALGDPLELEVDSTPPDGWNYWAWVGTRGVQLLATSGFHSIWIMGTWDAIPTPLRETLPRAIESLILPAIAEVSPPHA